MQKSQENTWGCKNHKKTHEIKSFFGKVASLRWWSSELFSWYRVVYDILLSVMLPHLKNSRLKSSGMPLRNMLMDTRPKLKAHEVNFFVSFRSHVQWILKIGISSLHFNMSTVTLKVKTCLYIIWICYLAAPRPTFVLCQGKNLINQIIIQCVFCNSWLEAHWCQEWVLAPTENPVGFKPTTFWS